MIKKILSVILGIVLLFVFVANTSAVVPDDLVGWWRFEENADDSSGNSNDGTEYGDVGYDNTDPISGYYSTYDGSGDYIEVVDDPTLEHSNITLEAWVRKDGSPGSYKYIAGKKYAGGFASYALYTGPSGGLYFYIGHTGSYVRSPDYGTSIWDGDWHHVAGTYDGLSVKLFVDGVEVDGTTTSAVIAYNSNNFYIGSYGAGYYFNGNIDEVKIWDEALTQYDIYYEYIGEGELDYCPGTAPETFDDWGTNRWLWDGFDDGWIQNTKNEKASKKTFSIADTRGCNCEQILDELVAATGFDFEGHYKFGCSSSILEDWIAGEYFMETVEVLANDSDGVNSDTSFMTGDDLLIKSRGVYYWTGGWQADTEYAMRPSWWPIGYGGPGWISGDLSPHPWEDGLDLVINSLGYDWVGSYSSPVASNEYTLDYIVLSDGPLNFKISDNNYGDNSGSLFVDIFADLY